MTSSPRPASTQEAAREGRGRGNAMALFVIASCQLMVVLDITIVNIALPHIQRSSTSTASLSWVVNAYTLTFGGLLLLGGRAGDILGRRRVFIFGVLLFVLASLLGGLAQNAGQLLAARALQGVGGAIASPTSLALISTTFREGPERNRAFGVFAAVSAGGGAIGLLAGGILVEWLNWRWVLFVNVPIGLLIALATPRYIKESERHPGRFDVVGALTSTVGMVLLVYGFIRAAQDGWRDPDAGVVRGRGGRAGGVRAAGTAVAAADHTAAHVRGPQQSGYVRDHAVPGRGDVRHVLLPDPVRAERAGLQPSGRASPSCR